MNQGIKKVLLGVCCLALLLMFGLLVLSLRGSGPTGEGADETAAQPLPVPTIQAAQHATPVRETPRPTPAAPAPRSAPAPAPAPVQVLPHSQEPRPRLGVITGTVRRALSASAIPRVRLERSQVRFRDETELERRARALSGELAEARRTAGWSRARIQRAEKELQELRSTIKKERGGREPPARELEQNDPRREGEARSAERGGRERR